jgi:hypothetical protein
MGIAAWLLHVATITAAPCASGGKRTATCHHSPLGVRHWSYVGEPRVYSTLHDSDPFENLLKTSRLVAFRLSELRGLSASLAQVVSPYKTNQHAWVGQRHVLCVDISKGRRRTTCTTACNITCKVPMHAPQGGFVMRSNGSPTSPSR